MQLFFLTFGLLITNIPHLVSAINGLRHGIIKKIGKRVYFSIYGLTSTLGLGFIIYGFIDRDFIVVFEPAAWMVNLNKDIMFFSLWLLTSQFFKTYTKYYLKLPLMLAVLLWAAGHLVANGDLYSIILFGGFLIYAIIGIAIKIMDNFDIVKPQISNDIKSFFIAVILYIIIGYSHYLIAGIDVFSR